MEQIVTKEQEIGKINNHTEKSQLQSKIKENKNKIADEVNAVFAAEISAFPKFTAQIEMKNFHFSWFNNKK